MDNNNLDYESTSEDNTSIEENERIVKLTKKASSKYISNSNSKPKIINMPNIKINTNQNNTPRNIIKISQTNLLLIKGRHK